jgi:4-amino-4-deoxy-L-arabinose transferase-like glycosyltransferase
MLAPFDHRSMRTWTLLLGLLVCTALQAAIVFHFIGRNPGGAKNDYFPALLGGDAHEYHQPALNILHHQAFSLSETEPLQPTILRTPGYSAFLACVYAVFGESPLSVRVLQFALLAATGWIIHRLVRELVSQRAATIAALLCVTYPPLALLAAYHMTEVLATFLTASLLLLVLRIRSNSKAVLRLSLATGLVAGLLTLVRPTQTILIAAVLAVLAYGWRRELKSRALVLACVAVAWLSLIAPWLIRNRVVSGSATMGAYSGQSLYVSAQQYSGELRIRMLGSDWGQISRELKERTVRAHAAVGSEDAPISRFSDAAANAREERFRDVQYTQDAIERFRSVPVGTYFRRIPQRLFVMWNTADVWGSSAALGLLLKVHWVAMCLLMLVGAYLSRGSLLRQWPLWIVALYLTAVHLVFHVEGRYSIPARVFLMVYAAVALDRVLGALSTRLQPSAFASPSHPEL